MMRTLVILVCTISLFLTGCKTGNKSTHCGTGCCEVACHQTANGGAGCCEVSCGAPAVSCGAVHVGVAAKPEPVQVAETKEEEIKPVALEQPKLEEKVIPARKPIAQPEPEPIQVPEYAHAQDYRWLVGQLQRVHSPQHQWKIRYAALDEDDEWGGSMVLSQDARLDRCKDGDMVYVEGEILNARPSLYLSGPCTASAPSARPKTPRRSC